MYDILLMERNPQTWLKVRSEKTSPAVFSRISEPTTVFQTNQGIKSLKWAACPFNPPWQSYHFLMCKAPITPKYQLYIHPPRKQNMFNARSSPLIFESRVQPLCPNLRMNSPSKRNLLNPNSSRLPRDL